MSIFFLSLLFTLVLCLFYRSFESYTQTFSAHLVARFISYIGHHFVAKCACMLTLKARMHHIQSLSRSLRHARTHAVILIDDCASAYVSQG